MGGEERKARLPAGIVGALIGEVERVLGPDEPGPLGR